MKQLYLIANPLYDGVFKALMDNLENARVFLSILLGVTIESLRFTSREMVTVPPGSPTKENTGVTAPSPSILRLDFCAVIRTAAGTSAQVIIELQKTLLSGDIMRFRHYLATRYATREIPLNAPVGARPEPLPVICVYLLGFVVDKRLPLVTRIERRYMDPISGSSLELTPGNRPEFVERLTHDALFVQLPLIRRFGQGSESTRLERLLSVFDQTRTVEGDRHRLDYYAPDAKLDKDLARIVRHLHKLQTDPAMERIMSAEDLFELEQQRIHEDLTQDLRRALSDSERLREKEQQLREKEQQLREEEQRRREEEQRLREREQQLREAAELELARLRKLLGEAADTSD